MPKTRIKAHARKGTRGVRNHTRSTTKKSKRKVSAPSRGHTGTYQDAFGRFEFTEAELRQNLSPKVQFWRKDIMINATFPREKAIEGLLSGKYHYISNQAIMPRSEL